MGVNTSIYGEQANWVSFGGTHENLDNSYFYANFGSSTSYDISTLKAAIDNGKLEINTPIDKTLSWCGLGEESMFSKIESYNNKVWEDENDPFKMMNKDSRTVTNFGLFGKAGTWTLASPTVSSWYYSDATSQVYASRARWSPEAGNGETSTTSNFNLGLMPVTQLPMRNCVAVPVIECCTAVDVNPSNDGRTRAYSWEYFNPNSSINYQNHPYVTAIGMQLWGYNTDDFSGYRTNRVPGNIHIAVLDETDACKGQPFDIEQPTRTQDSTYQYYGMGRTYSTMSKRPIMGLTIMGLISTNASTIILPHQNNYQRKSRGNIIIPHPNGHLSYVNNPSSAVGVGDWVYYYVEYYDGLKEWIRQQIACFGIFFTDDEQTANNGEFDSENMFLGTLDSDMIGHGLYSHGADNRSQPQWNWATTNQSPYVPKDGSESEDDPYGDANHYLEAHAYSRGGKIYGTSDAGKWVNLLNEINDIDIHADGFNDSVFYGQEPLDCLIEGKLVFVNELLGAVNVTQNANIELGKHETQITATKIRATYPETIDCGDITIKGVYNDFRDFEPYTSINLLLPFAGSIELPPAIAMYHKVHLYETIDLLTGDLFYTIHIDDIEFGRAYGNCALELSKNGYAVSQYAQMRYSLHEQSRRSYFNAAASLLGGMSGTGIAASYGNVAGVVTQSLGGIANAVNSFLDGFNTGMYNRHTAPPVASNDKVSSCVEYGRCIVPAIVVTSPRMIKGYTDSDYKTQTGFATYKVGKIGLESGPVVCDSVNPSGLTCSAEEKRMIIEHLKQGIYIK